MCLGARSYPPSLSWLPIRTSGFTVKTRSQMGRSPRSVTIPSRACSLILFLLDLHLIILPKRIASNRVRQDYLLTFVRVRRPLAVTTAGPVADRDTRLSCRTLGVCGAFGVAPRRVR